MTANVLPWIPVPNDERQQETGSRAKINYSPGQSVKVVHSTSSDEQID